MFLGRTATQKPFNKKGVINHGPIKPGKQGIPSQEPDLGAFCKGRLRQSRRQELGMVCGRELCKDARVSFASSNSRVLDVPCSSPHLRSGMARTGEQPYWRLSTHSSPFPAVTVPGGQITREESSADLRRAGPAPLLPLPGAATQHPFT